MEEDDRHLDLLATFHYVVAGILALFGCLPIMHIAMGFAMATGSLEFGNNTKEFPSWMGWFFVGAGIAAMVFTWLLAAAVLMAGINLKRRERYLFCLVVAAFECMFMPFGTVLGVFTILVLSRPSVKQAFAQSC